MAWRKWVVRGLVFTVFAAFGLAVSVYQGLTSPDAIRQQVIDKLKAQMPGAVITLDSAHLRLLGGIAIDGLRLARTDDPDRVEFIHVPSAVIYHDKEQLLDGKLVIRKLELKNPHLHVIRNKAGRWNVSGILGRPRPEIMIPTVVVRHGTVLLEDYLNSPAPPAVEIKDVSATLINDPLPQVHFKGGGQSGLAGRVVIGGGWHRQEGTVALTIEAPDVPVRLPLVNWLAGYVPKLAEHARELEGKGALQAEFGFQPEEAGGGHWTHNVRFGLTDGRLRHPRIPLPLDHIDAALRCFDGEVKLDRCKARAGPSRLELTGWARLAEAESHSARHSIESLTPPRESFVPDGADFEGNLKIEGLQINSPLFEPLPEKLQKLNHDYEPNGPVNLAYHFARVSGQWKKHCVIDVEDLTATYEKFRYPLEHMKGRLDQEIDHQQGIDRLTVNLMGYAGTRPVKVEGTVVGEGPTAGVDVTISGDDLTIDEKLLASLPGRPEHTTQDLARSFHPAGRIDFQAFVRKPLGTTKFQNRYLMRFHDASVRYDVFPYPLENVSGELDVLPDHWEGRNFQGTHKGGVFRVRGRSHKEDDKDHLAVDIDGQSAVLDTELEEALLKGKCQEVGKTWKLFNPSGRINFVARVEGLPNQPPEADVTITALGCGIKPAFFPCQISDLTGTVRYARRGVRASHLRARHGQSVLIVDDAKAYLKPEGGCWVDIVYLRGAPLVLDTEMVDALPGVLKSVCQALHVVQPTDMRTWLRIDTKPDAEPTIFWDGELGFRDAALSAGVPVTGVSGKAGCRGRYDDHKLEGLTGHLDLASATVLQQPLKNIQSQFEVAPDKPDVLVFSGLTGQLFGGQVYGPARLEFGSAMRYELNLTASGVRLEEFGRHNLGPNAPVSGVANAGLYLSGEGNDLDNLTGRGSVDIPTGRLYNLPALLDLLKIVSLRLPDGSAFEEAHADFSLRGSHVTVHRIDLYGNVVSLRGQGEVNGKEVSLDFFAIWSRFTQFLPPVIKEIPHAVSKDLWKIKMRGQLGNIRCSQEPVPILVEPVKEFLQTVARRRGREPAEKR